MRSSRARPRRSSRSGLHRLVVPTTAGGLGARMGESAGVLMALGAVDGSTALGFAMQVHVVGALVDAAGVPGRASRAAVYRAIVDDGALLNNAATEDGGGSPSRGAIPGTTAVAEADGSWRLTGEKTWTTWLPNLTHAFVSARVDGTEPVEVGSWLVDLAADGVERRPGFEALGMRGSASGPPRARRRPGSRRRRSSPGGRPASPTRAGRRRASGSGSPSPRPTSGSGRAPGPPWLAGRSTDDRATARPRSPTSPASRCGSAALDAELRAARIVVLDVARRWDEAVAEGDAAGLAAAAADVPLAKLVATRAAVAATDEALQIAGGPGFLTGRLERAFRDARAGLINPPLEDVALTGLRGRRPRS